MSWISDERAFEAFVTAHGGGGLTAATFLGSSTVVKASGDTTGATDVTNINAALSGSNSSVYLNGSYYVNAPLVIPSNVTVILADCYIKLVNSTNKPIFVNPSYDQVSTPAASNIHIWGIGRAILDYNGANQTAQPTTPWVETAIMFCNVSNFSIKNIQTQNGIYVTLWCQACSNGRIEGIHCEVGATDLGYMHIDIGCTNIHIDSITANGNFPDAVFSMNSVANTAFPAVSETPYAHTLAGSARNISGISWSNITLSSGTGMFACFLDANGQCFDVTISNVHNTYTGSTINYEINNGPVGYHLRTIPVQGAVSNWRINGFTMGGTAHWLLGLDNPITDMQISNVMVGAGGSIGGLLGNQTAPTGIAGYYPQITRLKVTDVDIPVLNSGGALMKVAAGMQASDIQIENVRVGTASGPLLNNASDVQNLQLENVRVGILATAPFVSTGGETGVVKNFQYATKGSALTALLPNPVNFRIEQPFPDISSGDTVPHPIRGSTLNASNTIDPTGGSAVTGGYHVADGVSWNLVKSYNGVFKPQQIYRRCLFHFDAGSLLVANSAAVSDWMDQQNNIAVSQSTGANQPTFVAADAILNNKPSVSFNGSTQFLQSGNLTPFLGVSGAGSSIWVDCFIVFQYTTLATTTFIDFASTSAGSVGHGFYANRAASTDIQILNSGGGGPSSAAITAATPYLLYMAVSATSHLYLALNKAAQASETNTSVAGTNQCTGITLGAAYTGTSNAAVNIAEVVSLYGTGQISSADWATVAGGLAAKYNITLS